MRLDALAESIGFAGGCWYIVRELDRLVMNAIYRNRARKSGHVVQASSEAPSAHTVTCVDCGRRMQHFAFGPKCLDRKANPPGVIDATYDDDSNEKNVNPTNTST